MKNDGKLEEISEQMKRAELVIVGIFEIRQAKNGDFINEETRIIHNRNEKGENGIAVICKRKIEKQCFEYISCE